MPTTTAIFKLIPGDEIYHDPEQDRLPKTISVFSTNEISTSNKVSDTVDVETSLRTIVRSWPSIAVATDFATALQAEHTTTDELAPWPGRLISVQVNSE